MGVYITTHLDVNMYMTVSTCFFMCDKRRTTYS